MNEKLSCAVARDMLPMLADGLLSPESEAILKKHLAECAECREIYSAMSEAEPAPETDRVELDYLKKVKRGRTRVLIGALAAVALIAVGLLAWFRSQAEKTQVSYDEGSRTMVVYALGDGRDLKLPEEINEAHTLDAQFDSFHMAVFLPMLRTEDQPMEEYLPAYLSRTNDSLRFIRSYLRENCEDSFPAERADKYVELNISPESGYSWKKTEDRIILNIGSYYWHREELYILSLLGSRDVGWKQLGYAWYLGSCLDPYAEVLSTTPLDKLQDQPYYEAYRRLGGTDEITPENYRCLLDAVSWRCLSDRMYWGSPYESTPLRYTALYKGPTVSTDPGNEMSVSMAASFIAYLSDSYGFSQVSAFCFGQTDFEEAFGTDFQSAYDAWEAHLLSVAGGDA